MPPVQTTVIPIGNGSVSPSAMQLTSPLYYAPAPVPCSSTAAPVLRNWKGEPVSLPPHHIMSPVDLAMDQKPIVMRGPFTKEQKEKFRKERWFLIYEN